jgi:hypothetical protein
MTWIKFYSITYKQEYWYNILTQKSTFIKPNIYIVNYKLPENWIVILSKKYNKFFFYNTKTKKTQWNLPFPEDKCLKSLSWSGNSCYMDSILQSIFGPGIDNTLAEEILYSNLDLDTREKSCSIENRNLLQKELRKISNTIQNISDTDVKNVSEFRKILKNCPGNFEQFYDTNMRDSGEFLSYLLDFFPIGEKARTITTTYGTNSFSSNPELIESSKIVDTKASIIIAITPFQLLTITESIKLSNFLNTIDDSGKLDSPLIPDEGIGKGKSFFRRIAIKEMIDSPVIIFSVNRINPINNKYISTKLFPTKHIELKSKRKLELSAITIFQEHHYTCYFKCNNNWYYYDDTSPNRITISKLDLDLISRQGTQYFYF